MKPLHVRSLYLPRRRCTREVKLGDLALGAAHPIRIQSMTNTDTMDTAATVAQVESLVNVGCEIVRFTVPSKREAENLPQIRAALARRGLSVPLVADIHFTPNAAMIAAEHVEKIRINPGNFADKKRFTVLEYTDAAYAEEIERVAERFRPLVRRCKELGRAMRIGTNHGSLSDRILNRYGDTPRGMVESALEFLDVCEDEGYFDVVFSMKASNTQVAIQAYRLLAARLEERAPGRASYPFHVGVTEAGDGEDGRIKSAIGIGALFEDGIGDTIRVSLTEDPAREIPVARELAQRAEARWADAAKIPPPAIAEPYVEDPFDYSRHRTCELAVGELGWGAQNPVRVELDLGCLGPEPAVAAERVARELSKLRDISCEGLVVSLAEQERAFGLDVFAEELCQRGFPLPLSVRLSGVHQTLPACAARLIYALGVDTSGSEIEEVAERARAQRIPLQLVLRGELPAFQVLAERVRALVREGLRLILSTDCAQPVHAMRIVAAALREAGDADCLLQLTRNPSEAILPDKLLLESAVDFGSLLVDGLGDALLLPAGDGLSQAVELGYRILQGARLRTSWTEFISCPSCGRTLFDLEETTARIKARTGHLKGVKIAIMGCIVNGPGEMADADFGYVGAGTEKVNLYVGKSLVARNVPQTEADDRLVALIREQGMWSDTEN